MVALVPTPPWLGMIAIIRPTAIAGRRAVVSIMSAGGCTPSVPRIPLLLLPRCLVVSTTFGPALALVPSQITRVVTPADHLLVAVRMVAVAIINSYRHRHAINTYITSLLVAVAIIPHDGARRRLLARRRRQLARRWLPMKRRLLVARPRTRR